MLLVNKNLLTVDMDTGSDSVREDAKQNTQYDFENMILVCDTVSDIVFLTNEELSAAFEQISPALIDEFNDVYKVNNDIHDYIEAEGMMEDICFFVLGVLKIEVIKYFSELQDFCENNLVKNFKRGYNEKVT